MSMVLFPFFLIIPLINGNTLDKLELKTNSTTPVLTPILHNVDRKTNITVASEGGAIMSNTPSLSLPKENVAIPIISPKEISSNKVKPRKGAIMNSKEDNEDLSLVEVKQNDTTKNLDQSIPHTNVNIGENIAKDINNSSTSNSTTNIKIVHKPTKLSAEALAKTDEINNVSLLTDVVNERPGKYKMNSSGHPGMIMPIVITILVVPMFAVIGYMALKRGQEAWKNRHYKRMDFLLDGMYND